MPSSSLNAQIRSSGPTFNRSSGFDSFNSAKYLFPNENRQTDEDRVPTPDLRTYIKMTEPDDRFPTLSRRDDSGLVSISPSAPNLDIY